MSGLVKNLLRSPALRAVLGQKSFHVGSAHTRNLWQLSSVLNRPGKELQVKCCSAPAGFHSKSCLLQKTSESSLTQGEKELSEFLVEEIAAEKKLQKAKKIPTELDGFTVKIDGSEIIMKKLTGNEAVEVSFNINHTVDTDSEPEVDPSMDKPEFGEMKSRPTFEVEIKRGTKTLGFTCSMVAPQSPPSDDGYNDLFAIDEVVMYDGEWKEQNYSASGDVLDGTLYDLLMNLLEDKGISNEFVEKVSDFSTAYEHSCYINMLEDIQKFASGK